METMGERIKRLRIERKLTQEELGDKVGLKRAAINKYEKGNVKNMKRSVIEQMSSIFDVTPSYLMALDTEEKASKISQAKPVKTTRTAFYDVNLAAGTPDEVEALYKENIQFVEMPDVVLGKYSGRKDIAMLKVNGDSMNNVLQNGGVVAIQQIDNTTVKDNDIVVFKNEWGYSIKRILFDKENNKVIFRPDSTDARFTDYVVTEDTLEQVTIVGKVIMSIAIY